MIRGVYTAASAMVVQENAQAVRASNLANVNTPGYQGDIATFESFRLGALLRTGTDGSRGPIGEIGGGAVVGTVSLDRSAGPLQSTDNPLDVALTAPDQFFVVQTPAGERLTRAGAFTINSDGTLADTSGNPVLGDRDQPLRLPQNSADARLDGSGNLLAGNQIIGRLKVVRLDANAPDPIKEGGRLLRPASAVEPVRDYRVLPGSLEQSNVSTIEEMVGMITAMRGYEAAAKALQGEDETLGKALNEVAHRA